MKPTKGRMVCVGRRLKKEIVMSHQCSKKSLAGISAVSQNKFLAQANLHIFTSKSHSMIFYIQTLYRDLKRMDRSHSQFYTPSSNLHVQKSR